MEFYDPLPKNSRICSGFRKTGADEIGIITECRSTESATQRSDAASLRLPRRLQLIYEPR